MLLDFNQLFIQLNEKNSLLNILAIFRSLKTVKDRNRIISVAPQFVYFDSKPVMNFLGSNKHTTDDKV